MNDTNLFTKSKKYEFKFVTRFKNVWKGQNLTHFDPNVLMVMRTRAWIVFSFLSAIRVYGIVKGSGGWFTEPIHCSEEVKSDCIVDYNEALMDPLTPATGYILQGLQIPAVIACILCLKWRFIADYFFAAENFMLFVAVLHLNYLNYSDDFPSLFSRIVGLWITLSISYRYEIIVLVLNGVFQMSVGIKIVYS